MLALYQNGGSVNEYVLLKVDTKSDNVICKRSIIIFFLSSNLSSLTCWITENSSPITFYHIPPKIKSEHWQKFFKILIFLIFYWKKKSVRKGSEVPCLVKVEFSRLRKFLPIQNFPHPFSKNTIICLFGV